MCRRRQWFTDGLPCFLRSTRNIHLNIRNKIINNNFSTTSCVCVCSFCFFFWLTSVVYTTNETESQYVYVLCGWKRKTVVIVIVEVLEWHQTYIHTTHTQTNEHFLSVSRAFYLSYSILLSLIICLPHAFARYLYYACVCVACMNQFHY